MFEKWKKKFKECMNMKYFPCRRFAFVSWCPYMKGVKRLGVMVSWANSNCVLYTLCKFFKQKKEAKKR